MAPCFAVGARSKAGCSLTELTVGEECSKRPLFIIITVAAQVTDRSLGSHKRGVGRGRSYLRGGADRTGDPMMSSVVFHAVHVVLGFKLGDHEGLAPFGHGRLLKRTLLVVLPAILIRIPIRARLSPAPVCCGGRTGTAWWHPALGNSVSVSYILHYFS